MDRKKVLSSLLSTLIFIVGAFSIYYTFSIEDNYIIDSSLYDIEDNYITRVSPNTSIDIYYEYFELENCTIKLVDSDDNEIISGYVYNGSKTIVYDNSNHILSKYTNIVKGDYNEDGILDNNDLVEIGNAIVNKIDLLEYQVKALDMDNDNLVAINDLSKIDKILSDGYQDISLEYISYNLLEGESVRVIPTISPNYILDQNLIWESSDSNIASVDNTGLINAINEGSTIITLKTKDNKISKSIEVVVDNTIKLAYYEGNAYANGYDLVVGIRSIDYNDISCSSSDSSIAICEVDNKSLIINGVYDGEADITVSSLLYGETTFKVYSHSTNISIMPKYGCMPKNAKAYPRFSSFNAGTLSYNVSDSEIITNTYVEGNQLFIYSGNKSGRATISVSGSITRSVGSVTVDVYYLAIPAMGTAVSLNDTASSDIVSENVGRLVCENPNEDIALCSIEDNKIVVYGKQKGAAYMKVKNILTYNEVEYECGEASFIAVVQ